MKEQRLGTRRWQILFLWWQVRVLLPAGPCSSQKHAPVYGEGREEGGSKTRLGGQWPATPCKWALTVGSLSTAHLGGGGSWQLLTPGNAGRPLLFSWPHKWSCFCLQTPEQVCGSGSSPSSKQEKGEGGGSTTALECPRDALPSLTNLPKEMRSDKWLGPD